MMFENPEADTSIVVGDLQRDLLRSVAGRNDAQRLRIVTSTIDLEDIEVRERGDRGGNRLPVHSQDRDFLNKIPAPSQDTSLKSLLHSWESVHGLDLENNQNVLPSR